VNPPIRSHDHAEAIWAGILDGTIGGIATDHAPHTLEEKTNDNIWNVVSGFAGVETSVPLMLTQVNQGRLSLHDYVRLAAENPAHYFNLFPHKGVIAVGSAADFTIVDMNAADKIDSNRLHNRSPATPFDGWQVTGIPVYTIVGGRVVMAYENINEPAVGRHVETCV
jgi:dihydroorotase